MKTYTIVNRETGEAVEHIAHKGRPLTVDGQEIPDPTPMAPPLGFKKQPTMADHIREAIRGEHLRLAAEAAGQETFEEANDFDTGEDDELNTIYEIGESQPDFELLNRATGRSASSEDDGSAAGAEAREAKPPSPSKKKPAVRAPEPDEEGSEED